MLNRARQPSAGSILAPFLQDDESCQTNQRSFRADWKWAAQGDRPLLRLEINDAPEGPSAHSNRLEGRPGCGAHASLLGDALQKVDSQAISGPSFPVLLRRKQKSRPCLGNLGSRFGTVSDRGRSQYNDPPAARRFNCESGILVFGQSIGRFHTPEVAPRGGIQTPTSRSGRHEGRWVRESILRDATPAASRLQDGGEKVAHQSSHPIARLCPPRAFARDPLGFASRRPSGVTRFRSRALPGPTGLGP